MSKLEKFSNWLKRHKILTGVLAFIILCLIAGVAGNGKPKNPNIPPPPTTNTNTQSTPAVAPVNNKISEAAAETYCQDAGLLGKYINLSNTSIIYITNYNEHYTDTGEQAANGDEIWDLQWDGKNKTTGESIGFVCMVSGTDRTVTLHDLAINGSTAYGPVDE